MQTGIEEFKGISQDRIRTMGWEVILSCRRWKADRHSEFGSLRDFGGCKPRKTVSRSQAPAPRRSGTSPLEPGCQSGRQHYSAPIEENSLSTAVPVAKRLSGSQPETFFRVAEK